MRSALLLLLLICPVFCQVAPAQNAKAPTPVEIVTLEQKLWTTLAEGDYAKVRSLFTHDYIQVDDHISSLDTLLAGLKECKLTSYDLRDLQVRILTPDSALTAYHVVNTFECGTAAKPVSRSLDNNSTTVWVRQPGSGRWLAQVHTETPAKP